jgi:hypothetical protein
MKGKVFEFDSPDTFLFGRASDCHAHLPDDGFVSRHHFLLEMRPPHARIRDLGSLNGTHVNEIKIGGRDLGTVPLQSTVQEYPQVDLPTEATIHVGRTVFSFLGERQSDNAGPMLCAQCGDDVTHELDSGEAGAYTCRSCRAALATDPIQFAETIASDQSDKRANAQPLDVKEYEIMDKLGQGGMATVYRARHMASGADVALKVILSASAVDDRDRGVFHREMELLQRLNHNNIVRFLESGDAGSVFYFVMELCNSGDLDKYISRFNGPVPLDRAIKVMQQVLQGMDHAHKQGMVHRDIKPANILFNRTNGKTTLKVCDFGIAKNFEQAGLSGLTTTGSFGGTVHFMPREQLTDYKFVTPASDVWSLGAVFYYMVTGQHPRECQHAKDPLQIILEGTVIPVRDRNSAIPDPIANIIDKTLDINYENRYPTATEFLQALQRLS